MRDMSYFTNIDPMDYKQMDDVKHLQFKDYKHLRDVSFDDPISEPMPIKILATMGFIMCLIVLLFIA